MLAWYRLFTKHYVRAERYMRDMRHILIRGRSELRIYFLKKQKMCCNTRTGIHSHLMQYMTPKGGPKSANHVEPSSRICLPKVHSEKKRKTSSLPIVVGTALSSNNISDVNRTNCLSDLRFHHFTYRLLMHLVSLFVAVACNVCIT